MTKEEKAEYMRWYRAEHPEYRDYMKRWKEEHREQTRQYNRQYYEIHWETACDRSTLWQTNNPVQRAIISKVCVANRRYPGRITTHDLRCIIDRDGWKCYWCQKEIILLRDLTLEHLAPVNDVQYLTIACRACNSANLPSTGRTRRFTSEERKARVQSEKKRARDDQWRHDNREHYNERQRERYWAHIEAKRAYHREWQRKKSAKLKAE